MSAAYEIYRGVVAQAGADFLAAVQQAEVKRAAVVQIAANAAKVEIQPGYPPQVSDQSGAVDRSIAFDAVRSAALAVRQAEVFAAEQRRQAQISRAADLLRATGELP